MICLCSSTISIAVATHSLLRNRGAISAGLFGSEWKYPYNEAAGLTSTWTRYSFIRGKQQFINGEVISFFL
jgi:hypothetical protein